MTGYPEYERWCNDSRFDEETRWELRALTDPAEIEDRFYKELSFGTGGLRGVVGAGINRMNRYTVGRATQGLADYLNECFEAPSVAIAYDSRSMSAEFARDSALILAANGIKAYLFDGLRPTPELSFAIRYLGASAGIVITASHNPPAYNGYKVYWSDGCQIVPPHDAAIIARVRQTGDYTGIARMSVEEAAARGLLVSVGEEIDRAFARAVIGLSLSPDAVKRQAGGLKIVYTPLCGAGNLPVRRVLHTLGYTVFTVPEEEEADPAFAGLKKPNPEEPEAFARALALAEKVDADLVIATDPDADRFGLYTKESTGYRRFTGNTAGVLLAEYVLSRRAACGLLPERRADGALVTTIVSSNAGRAIAEAYGLTYIETLTGFKYIGEQIGKFEAARNKIGGKTDAACGALVYEFGYEESFGCLVDGFVRDKDSVSAVAMICEAACVARERGHTLGEELDALYEKYGYFAEGQESVPIRGGEGARQTARVLQTLRDAPPERFGELKTVAVRDYRAGWRRSAEGEQRLGLPPSDVLYFELEEDGWCCVRGSGTEPKIKFYFGAKGKTEETARRRMEGVKSAMMRAIGEMQ